MKTKLTTLALSVIMTCGLVAAAAPPVERKTEARDVMVLVNECRKAHLEFRRGNRSQLDNMMKALDANGQKVMVLTCIAYGEGFDDGRNLRNIT